MILIFSEPADISTCKVLSYLDSMKAENIKVLHTKGLTFSDARPYLKLLADNKSSAVFFAQL